MKRRMGNLPAYLKSIVDASKQEGRTSAQFLTEDGLAKLQAELEHLQNDRMRVYVDLLTDATYERTGSEDADTIVIRQEIFKMEKRIRRINKLISGATIIGKKDNQDLITTKKDDDELMGIVLFSNRLEVVTLTRDGDYKFIDETTKIHNILYALGSETKRFSQAIEELEYLLNDPATPESGFQDFFQRYPDLIKGDEYKSVRSQVVLGREDQGPLRPDFMLQPINQNRLWDILDLKLPTSNILVHKKNRPRFSSMVHEGIAQLREYSAYFDEKKNRDWILEQYGIKAYKPKLILVMGKEASLDPFVLRKAEVSFPELTLLTYEDLLIRAKAKIDKYKGQILIP